ncbi:MAG: SIMPL domain-containing protein [Candidatus Nitrosocosmicus sp.]
MGCKEFGVIYKTTWILPILFIFGISDLEPGSLFAQNETLIIDNKIKINSTLSVSESAKIEVEQDTVILSLGIESTNNTAQTALESNLKVMNKTVSALLSQGLSQNELSTSYFTVYPNYDYTEDYLIPGGNIESFTVLNQIEIKSHYINNTLKWVDAAVKSGVNNINGIEFDVSKERSDGIIKSLIIKSIENAKQKADSIAVSMGLSVIGIKSIVVKEPDVGFLNYPLTEHTNLDLSLADTADIAAPIVPGKNDVYVKVDVVFFLD